MIRYSLSAFFSLMLLHAFSRDPDSVMIRMIFNEALSDTTAYSNLRHLTTRIGPRLCGSPQAEEAVTWAKNVLEGMDPDTVWLQEVKVRHWVRGIEELTIVGHNKQGTRQQAIDNSFTVCAIGGSVGTPEDGITGSIIEVKDFDDLKGLGRNAIEGKIVFFNKPANQEVYYTFDAYGGVARNRVYGATEAAKYGASAVIVRSATLAHDDFPHTGILHYNDTIPKIPALSISTNDADNLCKRLDNSPDLTVTLRLTSSEQPETKSFNVIAEIRGSEHPEEVIVVGGHLDSWDNSPGAHDDGAGVVQSIEVLRLFKTLGIKPKRTIRVVVFMDEEMEQRGAKAYAGYSKQMMDTAPLSRQTAVDSNVITSGKEPQQQKSEKQETRNELPLAAIEADRGGTTPFGFSIDASDQKVAEIRKYKDLLLPYGLYYFEKGGSGVDIRDLKPFGTTLMAMVTDSQRYFDYHHSANDTFDKVHPRELQLGSFAMAAMVYLIDLYGL